MSSIIGEYVGDLRVLSQHQHSGVELITDAPLDNQGKAESFSPTDLVATALGACILTIMGIHARDNGYSIDGTITKTKKIMSTEGPRIIDEIIIDFYFPQNDYTDKQKKILNNFIKACPVSRSLNPSIKQTVNLHF